MGFTLPLEITCISLSIAAFVSGDRTKVLMNVREGVARRDRGLEEGEVGGSEERERGA